MGRVLFFTAPPLDANPVPEATQSLGHSLRYLADKARSKEETDRKRKLREVELETAAKERMKRMRTDAESKKNGLVDQKLAYVQAWSEDLAKGTNVLYKQLYGDEWKEMRDADVSRLAIQQSEVSKHQKDIKDFQMMRKTEVKGIEVTGFKWI